VNKTCEFNKECLYLSYTKTKYLEIMTIQDKAYELMTIKANLLEVTLGERTNVETIKEGRTSFIYKVWFCNSNNKIKTRIINISLKGY
jgi:hypothetical protein